MCLIHQYAVLSTFEIFCRGLMATSFSRLVVQLLEPTFEGWRKKSPNYCWWKKSETTNPVNNGIFTISTGDRPSSSINSSWQIALGRWTFLDTKIDDFCCKVMGFQRIFVTGDDPIWDVFFQRLKPPGLRWFFFCKFHFVPKKHILLKTLHSS